MHDTTDELLKTATTAAAIALGAALVLQPHILPAGSAAMQRAVVDLTDALHELMQLHRPF